MPSKKISSGAVQMTMMPAEAEQQPRGDELKSLRLRSYMQDTDSRDGNEASRGQTLVFLFSSKETARVTQKMVLVGNGPHG